MRPIVSSRNPVKEENQILWINDQRTKKYPKLAEVARVLLCIPAASLESERVWSIAGNILTTDAQTICGCYCI